MYVKMHASGTFQEFDVFSEVTTPVWNQEFQYLVERWLNGLRDPESTFSFTLLRIINRLFTICNVLERKFTCS